MLRLLSVFFFPNTLPSCRHYIPYIFLNNCPLNVPILLYYRNSLSVSLVRNLYFYCFIFHIFQHSISPDGYIYTALMQSNNFNLQRCNNGTLWIYKTIVPLKWYEPICHTQINLIGVYTSIKKIKINIPVWVIKQSQTNIVFLFRLLSNRTTNCGNN